MPDEAAELTALEFIPQDELIEELLRRDGFAGILFWFPAGSVRGPVGKLITGDAKMHWRNMSPDDAIHNLQLAIETIQAQQAAGG